MRTIRLIGTAVLAVAATIGTGLAAASPADAAAAPTCQGERATIVGTGGEDSLRGTSGKDVIVALGGDDVVSGRGGDDVICGGTGDDTVRGGAGDDTLAGQQDSDRLAGDSGDDTVLGGGDRHYDDPVSGPGVVGDVLEGGGGDDRINAGPGMGSPRDLVIDPDLVIYENSPAGVTADLSSGPSAGKVSITGQGTDTLVWRTQVGIVGSAHDDTLTGSERDDFFVGGPGDDVLDGGGGADTL